MAEDYEPMSDGLVKMILRTAGFKSPDEVREAVKEVVVIPRVVQLTEEEQKRLESRRKSSRECKRRARERAKEQKRQQKLIDEANSINT